VFEMSKKLLSDLLERMVLEKKEKRREKM